MTEPESRTEQHRTQLLEEPSDLFVALKNLYLNYWPGFLDWLQPRLSEDGQAPGLSPPLLIGPSRAYSAQPVRLLVFGQQTEAWYNDRFTRAEPRGLIDTYMRIYRDEFKLGKVRAWTPFWQAVRYLERSLSVRTYASLWDNLNKLDEVRKQGAKPGRPTADVERAVSELFPVVLHEVELAKPDVVFFFTGENYDDLLARSIFRGACLESVRATVSGAAPVARVKHPLLPERAFRTHHPGYFRRMGRWQPTLDSLVQLARI
jgi:hypothetical protein